MSDEEDNEYEVERILEARVEKYRKRPILKFRVRWKGYGPEDDTWEPIESFDGSEPIIEGFWERVNSGGRDFRNASLFKVEEVFVPTGPPRKRKRRDQDTADSAPPPTKRKSEQKNQLEEHISTGSDPDKRFLKHDREQNAISEGLLPGHSPTMDIPVKRLDKSSENGIKETPHKLHNANLSPPTRQSRRINRRLVTSPDTTPPHDEDFVLDGSLFGSPAEQTKALPDSPSPQKSKISLESRPVLSFSPHTVPSVKKPLHRSAKPLIKVVDDPQMVAMEGAISVKARIVPGTSAIEANKKEIHAQPVRQKPGPGRSSMGIKKNTSSLLTFEKGALKTVKGKYVTSRRSISDPVQGDLKGDTTLPDVPSSDAEPPKADDLLELAGLDTQVAESLSSYEIVAPEADKPDVFRESAPASPTRQDDGKICSPAKDSLLPASSSITVPESTSAYWKRPTIFDPLIRGLDPGASKDLPSKVPGSIPFWLTLDHALSIPVFLSSSSPVATHARTLTRPGAFYKGNYALDMCKVMNTTGLPGPVTMAVDGKDDDKKHFERFCNRLHDGELFIVPSGIDVLAFWSIENATLSQLLKVQPVLDTHRIIFSKIIIHDYSKFSELVMYADPVPWLQYVGKYL